MRKTTQTRTEPNDAAEFVLVRCVTKVCCIFFWLLMFLCQIPLHTYQSHGYVDVTMDTHAIPTFADVLWLAEDDGDSLTQIRWVQCMPTNNMHLWNEWFYLTVLLQTKQVFNNDDDYNGQGQVDYILLILIYKKNVETGCLRQIKALSIGTLLEDRCGCRAELIAEPRCWGRTATRRPWGKSHSWRMSSWNYEPR